MEAIYQDYSGKGVKFYYVYKSLAHPENNGYAAPFTLQERLMHIAEAGRTLGSKITWLCDTMSNDLKHALGDAPNSEFIIDPNGIIVRRRAWSDPQKLRSDLVELIGPVENPTSPKDVRLGKVMAKKSAPSGVVPTMTVTDRMKPLRIEPKPSSSPHYAKLRAEISEPFSSSGKGQLFLGFHLDPLYQVHWNNLSEPLTYRITASPGLQMSALSGKGPNVSEESDSDPREFLLEIVRDNTRATGKLGPIQLTVDYFACNDEEGWCKAVSQSYTIHLEEDRDGGWVAKRFRVPGRQREGGRPDAGENGMGRGARPNSNRAAGAPMQTQRLEMMLERLRADDRDDDGKVSRREASQPVLRMFERMDTNHDGFIDQSELAVVEGRLRQSE